MAVSFIDGETTVGEWYHLSHSWHVGKKTMKFYKLNTLIEWVNVNPKAIRSH